MLAKDKLCFALDVPTANDAQLLINELSPHVGTFKVGLELFISGGPALIYMVKASGAKCFLDLKLHDIPETVSRAVKQGVSFGADFMTIHTSGGRVMMKAAVEAAEDKTKILGVTALTSLDDNDCYEMYNLERSILFLNLMNSARYCKIPGFVCSAKEVYMGKTSQPDSFFVVPGIRPLGTALGDQKSVGTPKIAISDGADLLVVGRPIRDANDRIEATKNILSEIESALK